MRIQQPENNETHKFQSERLNLLNFNPNSLKFINKVKQSNIPCLQSRHEKVNKTWDKQQVCSVCITTMPKL